VNGVFSSNDLELLCRAALRGLGIALLPLMLVHPFLESGKLVPVLLRAVGVEARIAVVYLEREFVPPPVRAFVDAVVEWAPTALELTLPEQCRAAVRSLGEAGKKKKKRTRR